MRKKHMILLSRSMFKDTTQDLIRKGYHYLRVYILVGG